jgi:hypothetical protein
MSDTPETDAAIKAQSEWKRPFVSYTMGGVTYDGPVATLCRKLERERDEARHEIKGWRNKWECAVEMAARAEIERDEARARK